MPASPRWCPGTSGSCAAPDRPIRSCVNPHKWLFTPFDLSVLYCRRMDVLRQAFALTPEYLKTSEGDAGVKNLMDTGIQLGRRFRALKLWMIMRHFGAEGLRGHLAEHMRLARLFADWVDAQRSLRARRAGTLQRRLLPAPRRRDATQSTSACSTRSTPPAKCSSRTRSSMGRYVLRLAIGNLNTTERHVARAWELLNSAAARHSSTAEPRTPIWSSFCSSNPRQSPAIHLTTPNPKDSAPAVSGGCAFYIGL